MALSGLSGNAAHAVARMRRALQRAAAEMALTQPDPYAGMPSLEIPTPFSYRKGVPSGGLAIPGAIPPLDTWNPALATAGSPFDVGFGAPELRLASFFPGGASAAGPAGGPVAARATRAATGAHSLPVPDFNAPAYGMPRSVPGNAVPLGHGFAGSPELAGRRYPAPAAPPRFFAGPGGGELAPPGMAVLPTRLRSPSGYGGGAGMGGANSTAGLVPWSMLLPLPAGTGVPLRSGSPVAEGRRSVHGVPVGPDPLLDETGDNAVLQVMRGARHGAPEPAVPGVTGRGSPPPAQGFPSAWGVQPEAPRPMPSLDAIALLDGLAGRAMPDLRGSRYDGGFDVAQPLPPTPRVPPDFDAEFRPPSMGVVHGPVQPVPGSKYNPSPELVRAQMDAANRAELEAIDTRRALEKALQARTAPVAPPGAVAPAVPARSVGGAFADFISNPFGLFGPDAAPQAVIPPPAVSAPRDGVWDPFGVLDHNKDQARHPGFPPAARGAPAPPPGGLPLRPPPLPASPAGGPPPGIGSAAPGPATIPAARRYAALAGSGIPVPPFSPIPFAPRAPYPATHSYTPIGGGAPFEPVAAAGPRGVSGHAGRRERSREMVPAGGAPASPPPAVPALAPAPSPGPRPAPPGRIMPLPTPRPVSIVHPAKLVLNGRILGQTIGSLVAGPLGGLVGAIFGGGLGTGTFGAGQPIAHPGAAPNYNRFGVSPFTPVGWTAPNFTPGGGGSTHAYKTQTGWTVDQYGNRVPTGSYIDSTGKTITYTME